MSSTPDIESAFELSLKLSRLSVDDSQRARLSADLGNILRYVESIEQVDTEKIEPLLSTLELSSSVATPLRADRITERDSELGQPASAPVSEDDNLYIVPQIISRDD